MTSRSAELQRNLAGVRQRISDACAQAGRPAGSVTLLPVTKTFPASDLTLLAELGCTEVGEGRDHEAREKREQCQASLRWHMIGQVQRKKARQIVQWADVVESVDRVELADALSAAAMQAGRSLDILIQLSLDPQGLAGRGGVSLGGLPALAAHIQRLPSLRLAGLMAVAPLGADPRVAFSALGAGHQELLSIAPGATVVSAGMSGDLEAAIACGATQVRIGGALLGNRPALK